MKEETESILFIILIGVFLFVVISGMPNLNGKKNKFRAGIIMVTALVIGICFWLMGFK